MLHIVAHSLSNRLEYQERFDDDEQLGCSRLMIFCTNTGNELLPEWMTWWAVSRYSESRSLNNARIFFMGSGTCNKGRWVSLRKRRQIVSGKACRYSTVPAAFSNCRFSGRTTAPPPVESTKGPGRSSNCRKVSVSRSLKAGSPFAAKYALIVMPKAVSIASSESTKGHEKCRATCRPADDLPEPGRPTNMILHDSGLFSICTINELLRVQ